MALKALVFCVGLVVQMQERDVSSGRHVPKRTGRGPQAAFLTTHEKFPGG